MRYEKWDIRYLSSLTLETPAAPGLSWNTEERILTTGRSPSGVTCHNNICIIKHWYLILIWNFDIISIGYSILIKNLIELYERDLSQKERNNKRNGKLPFGDGQDREYQLSVARADIYIHSIHFLPVRWGEMRTPCRKRTSPAHNTRGGSHYMKKIGFSNKWWLWKKIVRFAYLVSVSQGGWWL